MTSLLDPRGVVLEEPIVPAQRLARLDLRRILLVDNGKLGAEYGNYAAIWTVLERRLGDADLRHFECDLLAVVSQAGGSVEPVADRLIEEYAPEAVILALADIGGVSFQTARLSLAFEQRGVPTAVIAVPRGAVCVRAVCEARAPGLLPVTLGDTVRTDTAEAVAALTEDAFAEIEQRLTQTPRSGANETAQAAPAVADADWTRAAGAMRTYLDWTEAVGIGDGLPLIPPTQAAVDELLATVPDAADDVLFGPAVTSGRVGRVRDAAVNAAMTGLPPRAFPVVVAALRATARPNYQLDLAMCTTHPAGNAVIFSGPGAERFGLWGGAGCLGPGFRGNATVGRAVALCLTSVYGARPNGADLTAFGSPAEFTYCLAEDVVASPWPDSLADELGDGSPGVLVMKIESPRNILEDITLTPQGLCEAFAASATNVGSNNASVPGDIMLLINPEHASIFATAGWTRQDLQFALFNLVRIPRLKAAGHGQRPIQPAYSRHSMTFRRSVRRAKSASSSPEPPGRNRWSHRPGVLRADSGVRLGENDKHGAVSELFLASASGAALGIAAAIPRQAVAAQFDYKFGLDLTPEDPGNVRAVQMWKAVANETNGRLVVKTFPSNQLGSTPAMLSQVRLGALQFMFNSGAQFPMVPVTSIENLGYAFRNAKQALAAYDGPLGAYLRKEIEAAGIIAMPRVWDLGFLQIGNNVRAVTVASNLEGLKMRVPASPIWADLFKSFGAAPTPIGIDELYSALQTHIVDGTANTLSIMDGRRLPEVLKYVSISNTMWSAKWLICNKAAWDALGSDIQAVVLRNSTKYALLDREDHARTDPAIADKFRREGVNVTMSVDPSTFRAKLGPYYATWKKEFGPTAWDLLEAAVGKMG